jgi:hypothetical protein
VKVYHTASFAAAAAIEADGFRDATDRYMTENEYTGVWVSDRPLDENEGVTRAEVIFEIDVDEEMIREYEWIAEGMNYREWLVPATILNDAPQRRFSG